MKKIFILTVLFILPLCMMAQQEEDTENGVVSLAGKEGFTIGTKKGDFLFKRALRSIIMTMKDWIRLIIRIMWLIPDSPFLMLYSVLPGKHLIR